ncbi:MAG: TetR/AcrR family transcriptional regulator [Flavobacteriales bacterium]|nr:TetR/AcrR family transcriptional regulator [Flavobacteriales bacterium]
MGKLENNKRRNEEVILDAAIHLFATKGLDDTAISDIVAKSRLARGTFYNYFESKEEVWTVIVGQIIEKIDSTLIRDRKNAKTLQEFIFNSFYGYVKIFQNPVYFDLIIRNQPTFRKTIFSTDSITSIYKNLEKDLIESSHFEGLRPNQYKLTGYAMVGAGIELLIQSGDRLEESVIEELSTYFTELFIGGLDRIINKNYAV